MRVGFQAAAYLAGQVLTQIEGIEKTFLSLFAQKQNLPGDALAVLVGIHEVALDADRLQFATCLRGAAWRSLRSMLELASRTRLALRLD